MNSDTTRADEDFSSFTSNPDTAREADCNRIDAIGSKWRCLLGLSTDPVDVVVSESVHSDREAAELHAERWVNGEL